MTASTSTSRSGERTERGDEFQISLNQIDTIKRHEIIFSGERLIGGQELLKQISQGTNSVGLLPLPMGELTAQEIEEIKRIKSAQLN